MIVKNESANIERCLNSVKGIVDYISICDTGSTDNTIEIIESYLDTNKILGKVCQHEWKNFGYNRTLSAQASKKMLTEFGVSLESTYLLLLDADMVLNTVSELSLNLVQDDAYSLLQKSSTLAYYNTRLIRASLPWVCKGTTHEYWSCSIPHRQATLQSIVIDDREDGGSKSDKFERDLKLLFQGMQEEPDNERYIFYFAQTHKSLKHYEDAIKWYKIRIEKGGWKEEVWYSKYMVGQCYEEMGFWDLALLWYLDAYQYNPDRAEPLKNISGYYLKKGNNDLAYLFAKQGLSIPFPKNQILFISHPIYEYQLDEDLSIAAYYTRCRDEGFCAINRLLLKEKIPQDVKKRAYKNMLFYVQNLKDASFIPISAEHFPLEEHCYITNPGIQKVAGFSNFRSFAEPIVFDKGYLLLVHEVVFTDRSIYTHRFVYLDKNFKVEKLSKPFTFMHKGIEHCCGMALDHEDNNCVLSISIENRDIYLCTVNKKMIHSLLEKFSE